MSHGGKKEVAYRRQKLLLQINVIVRVLDYKNLHIYGVDESYGEVLVGITEGGMLRYSLVQRNGDGGSDLWNRASAFIVCWKLPILYGDQN